jgi:hypothetical protein
MSLGKACRPPPTSWISQNNVLRVSQTSPDPKPQQSLQSSPSRKVEIPKINVNPEHLREREESLHRESSRPIVSFSARLPDEYEVRRDMVRDPPPGALGKLLEVNRSRGHTTERASYRTFERRATAAFQVGISPFFYFLRCTPHMLDLECRRKRTRTCNHSAIAGRIASRCHF